MDLSNYLRFVLALTFVLGLIGLGAVLVRRYGFGLSPTAMRKGMDRRLKLVETLPLDAKRRAVLLRRDNVEHLVILGANGETVVETGIPAKPETAQTFDEALRNTHDTTVPGTDAPAPDGKGAP